MKSLVTLFLILLVDSSLQGQITLGLSGGANFSKPKFKDNSSSLEKGYIGFHAGINAKYQITDIVYFSIETQFSEKGYQPNGQYRFNGFNQPFPVGFSSYIFKNQYLDIIPEVELRVQDWLGVTLGAEYGFLLSSKRKPIGENWENHNVSSADKKDVGLTSALRFYFGKVNTTFRFIYGFHDIETTDLSSANAPNLDQKIYNRNFQIGLGYNIVPFKVKNKQKGPWY